MKQPESLTEALARRIILRDMNKIILNFEIPDVAEMCDALTSVRESKLVPLPIRGSVKLFIIFDIKHFHGLAAHLVTTMINEMIQHQILAPPGELRVEEIHSIPNTNQDAHITVSILRYDHDDATRSPSA